MQNDKETVTRRYVVDYLSIANRDIFVTEDGSYTTRYVYDASGRRISAEFDYAEGTHRGEAGENLQSDIAVSIGKVFYRTSILGSTLFAVDKDGNQIAHAIYDPWGKPLTETYTDSNYSGLENLNNYTGYTWDITLALYFAQNRFYDAELHRFMQEDTAKDGTNWYVYCGNGPVLRVDMWGKYYIKEETVNGHKEYVAVRQTWLNRLGRSLIKTFLPSALGGVLVKSAEAITEYVGGNSIEVITDVDITDTIISTVVTKTIEDALQQFAKEAVPYVKAIFYIKDFTEEYFGSIDRVTADDIIFKLLELTSMEIRSKDILIVERKMNYAYQFLKDFEWYFFGRVWVQSQYIRNPSGGFIKKYNYGPTYWEMDLRISNPGWLSSSNSRIDGYVREYYNVLMCSFWSTGKIGPGYLSASKWAEDWSESLRDYLNQYEARLNAILEAFKSYVEQ